MGEKVEGLKSLFSKKKNRQGDVKNNIGNGKAKELICTTHRHELGWGNCWREGGYLIEEGKGEKMGQL